MPGPLIRRTRSVVILGAGLVGKTSLINRFCRQAFAEDYVPTCEESIQRTISHQGFEVDLQIKDTQGLSDQDVLPAAHAIGYHGVMLVFSIASQRSFEIAKQVHQRLMLLTAGQPIPLVLVGNKSDLTSSSLRQVPTSVAEHVAQNMFHCPYIEVSAKFNDKCQRAFQILLDEISIAQNESSASSRGSICSWLGISASSCPSHRCTDFICCSSSSFDGDREEDALRWERYSILSISALLTFSAACCLVGAIFQERISTASSPSPTAASYLASILYCLSAIRAIVCAIGYWSIKSFFKNMLRFFEVLFGGWKSLFWNALFSHFPPTDRYYHACCLGLDRVPIAFPI